MGLSDFCISPQVNTVKILDPYSTSYASMKYYITCNGTTASPIQPTLNNLTSIVNIFDNQVNSLATTGKCSAEIYDMRQQVADMYTYVEYISNTTACYDIRNSLNSLLQENVCNTLFFGLFVIWSSQYVTAAALFLATVVASVIYQLFGRYWDYENDPEEDEEVGGVDDEAEYNYDENLDKGEGGHGISATTEEVETDPDYSHYNKYDEDGMDVYGENRNAAYNMSSKNAPSYRMNNLSANGYSSKQYTISLAR
jgi:hypothetical protein